MTRHYHILLISPDPLFVRDLLAATDLRYDLTVASDAGAGERDASRVAYDCILLGHPLPDRAATALLADLRSAAIRTPVVFLSSAGDEQLAVDALKAGATDYLSLPTLTPTHLAVTIRSCVRLRRAERSARSAEQKLQALLDDERRAREEAESAQARLKFLAEASRVLGESLDYQTTLSSVARLAVPTIADWCAVDLIDPDRPASAPALLTRLAVEHVDPAKVDLAHELQKRFPPRPSDPTGIYHVLRTGQPELYTDIPDELLARTIADAEQLRMVRDLQLRSAMIVPLSSRGRTLGVLSFVSTHPTRRYSQDDLYFAIDIARRAATAIDNALLFRDTQRALAGLQQAKESAETANRAKDQFLAVLSHELRTPLSPVLLTATALQSESDLAQIRDGLQVIRRNVELEARLIDDLLDLTRITRGKLPLNPEPLDAHTVLRNTLEIVRPDVEAKALTLHLDLKAKPASLFADPARLQQILWNLLKNAVKFTPEGGTITVRTLNRTEEPGLRTEHDAPATQSLIIEVSDTGIGISDDVLPRIFDAFEQGERTITRQFGGLGLGLAISKALAARHQGSLTASSHGKDRGATFTLTLPVATNLVASPLPASPVSQPAPSPHRAAGVGSAVRILLVDDHEDTMHSLHRLLERRGYAVEMSNSVRSAVAMGTQKPFDLLISDIGLPDGSGTEIPRRLRPVLPRLRAIALSGFGTEEDLRRSREAGFDEHLTKPVNINTLFSLIGRLTAGVTGEAIEGKQRAESLSA